MIKNIIRPFLIKFPWLRDALLHVKEMYRVSCQKKIKLKDLSPNAKLIYQELGDKLKSD